MALQIDQIRALADRVAASHSLEIVDIEFSGGAKHRTLRVFIEKDEATRAQLATEAAGNPTPRFRAVCRLRCSQALPTRIALFSPTTLGPSSTWKIWFLAPSTHSKFLHPGSSAGSPCRGTSPASRRPGQAADLYRNRRQSAISGRLTGFADGKLPWIFQPSNRRARHARLLPRRSWKSRSQTSKKPT